MNPWEKIRGRTRGEHERFLCALSDPRAAQHALLTQILDANTTSRYGRRHGFESIRDADDFRARVPVVRYEDLTEALEDMLAGKGNILCAGPVILYERTGGSTSGPKTIPHTEASLGAFRRAIHPWLHDLVENTPNLGAGKCYWAISPAARRHSPGAGDVPVGMQNDLVYFGKELMPLLAGLSAVPPDIAGIPDVDTWRYVTLRFLLDAEDLTMISVWSPTFLTALLEGGLAHSEDLVRDVAQGTLAPPGFRVKSSGSPFRPRPERARIIEQSLSGPVPDTAGLWPGLALISAWTSGSAARFIPGLRHTFPDVAIQGKGLLATEGVVTIPLTGHPCPVLAVNSGFYEFLDENGRSRLAHEVEAGATYRVLLTTPGGLYRYDIGDRVRVQGWIRQTPMLEFVGRGERTSDLCGEKLTEEQVVSALSTRQGFSMLAPSINGSPHYRLYVDRDRYDQDQAGMLAEHVDQLLENNPQYRYARRMRQLGPIEPRLCNSPMDVYARWAMQRGQRLGDIKPPVLCSESSCLEMLDGH
ncbi:MAG: GH3 auxin-responsive promoter family protein [Pseudomonadota bacterium]|nr:GH3 auxin-responsive promoter family protein [Pseudomonadota bacterium]